MVKYFCDACRSEISDTANRNVYKLTAHLPDGSSVKVEVEALVAINGTANYGHICNSCIQKTVAEGLISKRTLR